MSRNPALGSGFPAHAGRGESVDPDSRLLRWEVELTGVKVDVRDVPLADLRPCRRQDLARAVGDHGYGVGGKDRRNVCAVGLNLIPSALEGRVFVAGVL